MQTVNRCPKCEYTSDTAFAECPRCGIFVEKYLNIQQRKNDLREYADELARPFEQMKLAKTGALFIQQRKEWGEIVTGFETENKYIVMDDKGRHLYQATEETGSGLTVLSRYLLKSIRPFSIDVWSPTEGPLISVRRPFRFFLHRADIYNGNDGQVGTIQRRFAILRRIYSVTDHNGDALFEISGPLLRPWTFHIFQRGRNVGKISKKWGGLLKEMFTDADNFGVVFPDGIDARQKAILLGAVFLIDFVHFEK